MITEDDDNDGSSSTPPFIVSSVQFQNMNGDDSFALQLKIISSHYLSVLYILKFRMKSLLPVSASF